MSTQHQKSNPTGKPVLGYAQINAKPFSIRHYVFKSRQKSMAQSWPFSQKYLNLCHSKGISNILPPLQAPNSKESHRLGIIGETSLDETQQVSEPGEESWHEDTVHLLCGKLGHLSLSSRSGKKQRFKAQHNSTCEKGRRRKPKMKSLVDILAVAKRCVLDSNERIVVAGCCSTKLSSDDESQSKGMPSSHNPRSPHVSLVEKHKMSDDSFAGIGLCNKRRRTSHTSKSKAWGTKTSSCKTT